MQEIDSDASDDLAGSKSQQKALGFHPKLISKFTKLLSFYSQAIGGSRIGLSILTVNPVIRKLHLFALKNGNNNNGRIYAFKPVYLKTKTLADTICAGFTGRGTPEYLHHLDMAHAKQLGELSERCRFIRKNSRSSSCNLLTQLSRTSSADALINNAPKADSYLMFKNLPLKFPLAHILNLSRRDIITLLDMTIANDILCLRFCEQQYHDYSQEGLILAHQKINNGYAEILLSPKQKLDLHQLLENKGQKSWHHLIHSSDFYKKNKNKLLFEIFDDNHNPVLSLGVSSCDNQKDETLNELIISDIDIHLVMFDRNISRGDLLESSPRQPFKLFGDHKNSQVYSTFKTLCSLFMNSQLPEFTNFNWTSFCHHVEAGRGMGHISAQEYLLFTFANHYFGRGEFATFTRVIQHGPTSRLPREPKCISDLTRLEPKTPTFPAINQTTEVGIVYSTGEFETYRGARLLAFYEMMSKKGWSIDLHSIWWQQIQLCNDFEFKIEQQKMNQAMSAKEQPPNNSIEFSDRDTSIILDESTESPIHPPESTSWWGGCRFL